MAGNWTSGISGAQRQKSKIQPGRTSRKGLGKSKPRRQGAAAPPRPGSTLVFDIATVCWLSGRNPCSGAHWPQIESKSENLARAHVAHEAAQAQTAAGRCSGAMAAGFYACIRSFYKFLSFVPNSHLRSALAAAGAETRKSGPGARRAEDGASANRNGKGPRRHHGRVLRLYLAICDLFLTYVGRLRPIGLSNGQVFFKVL